MNKSFLCRLALTAAVAVSLAGVAFAQSAAVTNSLPAQNDSVAYLQRGMPTAQTKFAAAGNLAGVIKYVWAGTISTDPAYTFANGVVLWSGHAAGTITTSTITTEPNPTDGKRECYVLDQTTTTLTWTANTGQTVSTTIRASGVASVPTCIFYNATTATWYQGP